MGKPGAPRRRCWCGFFPKNPQGLKVHVAMMLKRPDRLIHGTGLSWTYVSLVELARSGAEVRIEERRIIARRRWVVPPGPWLRMGTLEPLLSVVMARSLIAEATP